MINCGDMMNKTFVVFLVGFVGIISLAFVVLVVAGLQEPKPVDNVALPQ